MPFAAVLIFGLGLWVFSEIFVFGLVADVIGLPAAIGATVLTSLLGFVWLRRLGRSARDEISAIFKNGARFTPETWQSRVLAALGGVLLVLPGFLSDCVGLALLAPAFRRPRVPRPADPEVIDLSPQDWRPTDEPDRR